jgi:hypothetical protein
VQDLWHHINAAHAGHTDVEQHDFETLPTHQVNGLLPRAGCTHRKALIRKEAN